ncbi:hypothetical protein D9611_013452 [Ephemerocybe angulata]|uniref:Uncharacterized protein n=1 Tax=Ephemerocybe angulata TaxID=980116 RepID=A0A8H5BVQ7_9AGAR|nr:hypothetical protein D9611_013452 [Tulosesus angulatus]
MASLIVIDDQPTTNASIPTIQYNPPANWKANQVCVACNLTSSAAMTRLYQNAYGGTWTNAWWAPDVRLLTASVDFRGSTVAAYFILFWRSEDPNSNGLGTLNFYIDNQLELSKDINADEYTFELDSTARTLLFQKSNLNPDVSHNFRIAWANNGSRPRVAIGLDEIEYTPSPSSTTGSTSTPGATSSTSASGSTGSSKRIAKIVAPTVVVVVAVLAALLAFMLWRKRRHGRKTGLAPHTPTTQGQQVPGLNMQYGSLQAQPFQVPSTVGRESHEGGSQIVSPSSMTMSASDYSALYASTASGGQEPPPYTDGQESAGESAGASVRKSRR